MTDDEIRYVKWKPEFLEIVSHTHFEQLAPRRESTLSGYEFHKDWCEKIEYEGGICTCDMPPNDDE